MNSSHTQLGNPNQSAVGVNSRGIWEAHRAEITELYAAKTLQEVRDEMESRHNFTATIKQWKNSLSKWELDKKYIKPAEYRAMVRKKREREENEPQKATQFLLDGVEVPPEKLVRYKKREEKNKGLNGQQGDAFTPPGLTCRTPPILHNNPSLRPSRVGGPSTGPDSPLSACRDVVPAQFSPIASTASLKTMQSNPIARSPSIESFDWFNEYIEYNQSVNSTPRPTASMLIELLLNFQETLNNYEEERSYKSFVEDLNLSCCIYCENFTVISRLNAIVEDSDDEKTVQRIKRWARATVQKTFQLGLEGEAFMNAVVPTAGSLAALFLALGEAWQAKPFLEYTIIEMSRFGTVRMGWRRLAALELADCNGKLGNKTKAVELLQVLFKDLYPKLVALSSEDLESYLDDFCICHQKDALVSLLLQRGIETPENEWRVDAEEFRLRLSAVEVIKGLFPGTVQEVEEDNIDGAKCRCERDDRC